MSSSRTARTSGRRPSTPSGSWGGTPCSVPATMPPPTGTSGPGRSAAPTSHAGRCGPDISSVPAPRIGSTTGGSTPSPGWRPPWPVIRARADPANGGPRVVAKSIHAQLAVEWIGSEFECDVLFLLRHPANVLASWMEVDLKDSRYSTLENRPDIRSRYLEPWGVPLPGADPIERMSWTIGLLLAVIEDTSARHPEWHVRTHEQLCADPLAEFRQLFADLGLHWGQGQRGIPPGPQHPRVRLHGETGGVRTARLVATASRRRPGGHPAPGARVVPADHVERSGLRP